MSSTPPTVSVQSATYDDANLKRYDALLRYLQTENQLLWSRSQHFLVAHAALLGFTLTRLPTPTDVVHPAHLLLSGFATFSGLLLALLWHWAITTGEFWTGHCHDLLQELEPTALGEDRKFIRQFKSSRRFISARKVARLTAVLFTALWLLCAGYVSWLALTKL